MVQSSEMSFSQSARELGINLGILLIRSMSVVGSCADNAAMEDFFG